MDFRKIIPLLIREFKDAKVDYALIGGFALGALGMVRATADVDFLIDARDYAKVAGIMKKLQYRCVHKTKNVSQFVSDIKVFGQVDFLHAFRKISLQMLKDASEKSIFEGKHTVKVLKPEDIIGLKVQAFANDPLRETRELADIELIMSHYKGQLDWKVIKEYFGLFDMDKKFNQLKKRYAKE